MNDFLGLEENTVSTFKFAPNEQISSLGISGCWVCLSGTNEIDWDWKTDQVGMLGKSFSSQLKWVIIAPGVNLAIFSKDQIVHWAADYFWYLKI